jgi:hypothetical protein
LYTNASGHTSSRLSDYSLVKEQINQIQSQTIAIQKLIASFVPIKVVEPSVGEANVIVCLAVVNACCEILYKPEFPTSRQQTTGPASSAHAET